MSGKWILASHMYVAHGSTQVNIASSVLKSVALSFTEAQHIECAAVTLSSPETIYDIYLSI